MDHFLFFIMYNAASCHIFMYDLNCIEASSFNVLYNVIYKMKVKNDTRAILTDARKLFVIIPHSFMILIPNKADKTKVTSSLLD